jgi:hypothetical protein
MTMISFMLIILLVMKVAGMEQLNGIMAVQGLMVYVKVYQP